MEDSEILTVSFTIPPATPSPPGGTGGSTGGGGVYTSNLGNNNNNNNTGGGNNTSKEGNTTSGPHPTVTLGKNNWKMNFPVCAFNALGFSNRIPLQQLRIQAGQTGKFSTGFGKNFAEQNAVLVRYNARTNELEFVSGSKVDKNGNASMNISQTGDFLVLTFKTGDVTGTGEVDTGDALAVLRHAVGLTQLNSIQQFVAKGKTGDLDTSDALNILRYAVGLVDKI